MLPPFGEANAAIVIFIHVMKEAFQLHIWHSDPSMEKGIT